MLRRAHLPAELLAQAEIGRSFSLPESVAHRFVHVLRLGVGERVELFDGAGIVVRGTLAPGDHLLVEERSIASNSLPPLVIAQAMCKIDKMEWVVEKGSELGASAFLLVDGERSVVDWGDKKQKRIERLARIAADAARQCNRSLVANVEGVLSMKELQTHVRDFVEKGGIAGVGALGAPQTWSAVLKQAKWQEHGAIFCVGPEGGFSPVEVQALQAAGASPVRLGAHVLRTETAALAALAVAQVVLGEA